MVKQTDHNDAQMVKQTDHNDAQMVKQTDHKHIIHKMNK